MTRQQQTRPLALALVLACLAPGAAAAQGLSDSRWLPWLGCWAPAGPPAAPSAVDELFGLDPVSAPVPALLVCISPAADGAGIVVATVREGEEVARRTLIADDQRRTVEVEGCSGWESARWSADGGRVFYRTAYTCAGGVTRESSGATMLLASGEWLDAELVRAGEARALEVRRYRYASDAEHRAHGREPPSGNALALETARRAAAATLSIGDVIEAASAVDEQVVQALLADYGERFPLDAEALVRLADAGVAGPTIDLMVALSNPDRFVVDRSALAAAYRVPEPAAGPSTRDVLGYSSRSYGGRYGYPSFWSSWRIGRYGYGYPHSLRYRYPGNRGWYRPYYRRWRGPPADPIIIVERRPDPGGRAVWGRGYTRRDRDDSSGTAVRVGRSRGDSGRSSVAPRSGGRATSGGYKASDDKKGSSGGRKAKRKTGGH